MIKLLTRLLKLPKNHSFFLFGPRGTGKSTLIDKVFDHGQALWINLLDPVEEDYYARKPEDLISKVLALPASVKHVVIDEIQKVPRLLDCVHSLIEVEIVPQLFILTGSSARKLRHGGANLLAGRAFVYNLSAFSFVELSDKFTLDTALQWGMLPEIYNLKSDEEKFQYLQAYTLTYLKEEIWAEQLVRKLDPFRKFLEVAAQCNGKIINHANIARDVGVDEKTIKNYFSILEDTLIGYFIEPYQHSFRKRLSQKPKFYFFDTGVVRALSRSLSVTLQASTSIYGEVFEHFVIAECRKLAGIYKPEYRFSYLKTKDDAEVDLVVERPGLPLLLIEIKSRTVVDKENLTTLMSFGKELNAEAICLCQESSSKKYDNVTIYNWAYGIEKYFS